ncbi:sensor histidine kinase [Streptomyces sp. A7024]|uniref:histidine kinase n=1 Tax=Streptomyces coryli TaxID=1128680 RepID=A0A6G4UDQ1_9ACTN|nr:sensor histidine kinase [Streptomyces coryli]NGN70349.1 sensor histidine kinase [Streptomyces coryli]
MRIRDWALTGLRGFALAALAIGGSLVLFIASVISIVFIVLGVGAFTTPWVLSLVRAHANVRRMLAAEWGGVRIPPAYRPFPADLRTGVIGQLERCKLMLSDPATWRDLRWLPVDMIFGFVTALLAGALVYYPLEGFALAAGLWQVLKGAMGGAYWYGFVPVNSQATAFAAAGLAAVLAAFGFHFRGYLLLPHFWLTKGLLAPREVDLEQRVERLTETRYDAVETSATELRRIERDLHDGAQARLVAMGMSLGAIEALIEKDPAKAKEMVAKARGDSAEALTELRDLVRGIHPPVLAERGLGPAAEALALRMPMPVDVHVELPGRFAEPVESAAYFAISEALTNAAKHSGAERMWLDLSYEDGRLRASVTDNGRGGANASGSGLRGIERRLGTFDGVLAVSSPAGGPTMITMEIPCALSSPKTSSS